jgi:hypothetical protein
VIERAAGRAAGARPARERRLPHALRGLLGQRQQDRQLRPVLEVAGDQRERIRVEDRAELVVAQPQPRLQQLDRG